MIAWDWPTWLLFGAITAWGLAGWVFVALYHNLTGRCIALLEQYRNYRSE